MDPILSRIKKLLNLTEARGATPDEAANAAAKVQDLLFQHNLSMASVAAHSIDKPTDGITETAHKVQGAKNSMRWRQVLYGSIARHNFCKILLMGSDRIAIFGKPSNTEVVQYMGEYIGNEIHKMARKAMLDEQKRTGQTVSWPYYTAFAQGAVSTISQRLADQQKKNETVSAACTALVVQSRGAVEAFITAAYPRRGTARPLRAASRADAYQHGQREGHNIPLSKGLTSNSMKARIA
jgi:acetylornithine deacetylase/succinyl-diaminopimelate desuccinylase-like protein